MNNLYKKNYRIGKSNIHGLGIFADRTLVKNQILGIAISFVNDNKNYIITDDLGKWINHSYNPNCHLIFDKLNNRYDLIASKIIFKNEELVADYDFTPSFINKPEKHYI